MTTHPQTDAVTVDAQTIHATVSGQPDIENKFGPGKIRPDRVRISYRGQHIDARVDGWWVRETGVLTTERLDQHYAVRDATDIVQWPDWLCALATLLRPAAVSAPAPAPTDRAALSARLWAVAEHNIVAEWICCEPLKPDHDLCAKGYEALRMVKALLVDDPEASRPAPLLDAVLPAPADRAAILREAATIAERVGRRVSSDAPHERRGEGAWETAAELRRAAAASGSGRVADETQAECGPAPSACDAESGEPCPKHEREAAHTEGEHCFCGPECAVVSQTDGEA